MTQKNLSAFTMCVTPFDKNGELDQTALRTLLRAQRDAGASVYVGGSGSGEGYSLSPEECETIYAVACGELKGRVSVRAMGCEPRSAEQMLEIVARAQRFDLDALHIYSLDMGHGVRPTKTEMEQYYCRVLDKVRIPAVLSSHRAAGYVLPLDLLEALIGRYPQICGFAYGGPDLLYLSEAIERFSDRISVYCSGVRQSVTTMALGGHGFMGHEGNISPRLTMAVVDDFRRADMVGLRRSFGDLMKLNSIGEKHGGSSARALKPLMNALGLPAGELRLPRVAITPEELHDVVTAVRAANIPELSGMLA